LILEDNIQRNYCPLCLDDRNKANLLKNTTVKCAGCGLVYNYKLAKKNITNIWEKYTFTEYDKNVTCFNSLFWESIIKMSKFKNKKGIMFDIGCGDGDLLQIAKKNNWQAIGLELTKEIADFASKESSCKVYVGNIEDRIEHENKFDLIIARDVWRHLQDPMEALKNCVEASNNNGKIIIRDLNIFHKKNYQRFLQSREYDLQCYSPETIKILFKKAGIAKIEIYPSPMALSTVPFMNKLPIKFKNLLIVFINKLISLIFLLSNKKWLTIVPEMIVIGTIPKKVVDTKCE
jgi:2-polyprenyl-3-methyl-5-hydroxy-6-metoxy-1,4-benzoquinol methylase